jgi:archaellum component FlaC
MTLNEFVTKYLGKKLDFDGAYGGQCVDLFRFYVRDVLGLPQPKGVVGAREFYTNFENDPILKANFTRIANTPDGVPEHGDAIIWDKWTGNNFGHVAVFLNGDANKFTSLDQNFPTLDKVTKTEHNYTSPKVLGWLRPNGVVNLPLRETVIDFDDGEGKRKMVGWYVSEWFNEKKKVKDLENEVMLTQSELDKIRNNYKICSNDSAELRSSVVEQEKTINRMVNEYEKLQKDYSELYEDAENLQDDLDELTVANIALISQNEKLTAQVDSLKKESLEYLTLGDFFKWMGSKLGIK